MNNLFKMLAAIFSVVLLSVAFVSCDFDDDEDVNPNSIKSVNVEYRLNLSQTYYDFYDITVTYNDEKGETHEIQVTEAWNYGFSVSPKVAPRKYSFIVRATPKEAHPDFDKPFYDLVPDVEAKFFCYRNNGEVFKELSSDYFWATLTNKETFHMSAEQSKSYYEDFSFRTLMLFEKTVDGNYY